MPDSKTVTGNGTKKIDLVNVLSLLPFLLVPSFQMNKAAKYHNKKGYLIS